MLADKDGDGFLTKEEYIATPEAQPDFMVGNVDEAFKNIADFVDDDEKVSKKESMIAYDLAFEYESLDAD